MPDSASRALKDATLKLVHDFLQASGLHQTAASLQHELTVSAPATTASTSAAASAAAVADTAATCAVNPDTPTPLPQAHPPSTTSQSPPPAPAPAPAPTSVSQETIQAVLSPNLAAGGLEKILLEYVGLKSTELARQLAFSEFGTTPFARSLLSNIFDLLKSCVDVLPATASVAEPTAANPHAPTFAATTGNSHYPKSAAILPSAAGRPASSPIPIRASPTPLPRSIVVSSFASNKVAARGRPKKILPSSPLAGPPVAPQSSLASAALPVSPFSGGARSADASASTPASASSALASDSALVNYAIPQPSGSGRTPSLPSSSEPQPSAPYLRSVGVSGSHRRKEDFRPRRKQVERLRLDEAIIGGQYHSAQDAHPSTTHGGLLARRTELTPEMVYNNELNAMLEYIAEQGTALLAEAKSHGPSAPDSGSASDDAFPAAPDAHAAASGQQEGSREPGSRSASPYPLWKAPGLDGLVDMFWKEIGRGDSPALKRRHDGDDHTAQSGASRENMRSRKRLHMDAGPEVQHSHLHQHEHEHESDVEAHREPEAAAVSSRSSARDSLAGSGAAEPSAAPSPHPAPESPAALADEEGESALAKMKLLQTINVQEKLQAVDLDDFFDDYYQDSD